MHLRKATLDDIGLLEYWDTKPHVIAATGAEYDSNWAVELTKDSPYQEWLISESDGRPIGAMLIIDPRNEETHYWGEIEPHLRAIDIWIGEESDLGRGYGTRMMTIAIERCFGDSDVTAVIVDPLTSNSRAHRFYERLGFEFTEERRFDEDNCRIYRLERGNWPSGH